MEAKSQMLSIGDLKDGSKMRNFALRFEGFKHHFQKKGLDLRFTAEKKSTAALRVRGRKRRQRKRRRVLWRDSVKMRNFLSVLFILIIYPSKNPSQNNL